MNFTDFKAKVEEKKEQAIDFVYRHKKKIIVSIVVSSITAAIVYLLSSDEDGTDEKKDFIEYYPDDTFESDASVIEMTESAPSESTRPYYWIEYSHPVREHIRRYSDGNESLVRGYEKITGGRTGFDNEDDENCVA